MSVHPVIAAQQKCTKVIKILMLGESNVGKTSLVTRYADNKFDSRSNLLTVGIDTRRITRMIGSKLVRLEFWDTAGQEKYKTIPSQYFKGVQGIILVYDITDGETFVRVEDWLEKISDNHGLDNLIIMLVGNKLDKADLREVKQQQAIIFAQSKGMKFKQTSAKNSTNVDTMVNQIATCIIDKGLLIDNDDGLKLNHSKVPQDKQKSCCS